MNKKLLVLGILFITVISFATGCGCEKKESNNDDQGVNNEIIENKNNDVVKDQTVEAFKFSNISLYYDVANKTTITKMVVTNTSDKDQELKEFKINVYKGDELLVTLSRYAGSVIKAGESKQVNGGCQEDLSEATRVEFIVVR